MKVQRLTPLILLGMLIVPAKALAHAVQTNYFLGNQLELESTFGNGEPFKGAKVTIYAPNNPTQPWLQGVTDAQGRFAFSPDENIEGDWDITIRQQGHGDFLTVPVREEGILADLISRLPGPDIHDLNEADAPLWGLGSVAIATATVSQSPFVF